MLRKLRRTRGYAFTHVGELRRTDGASLTSADASEALRITRLCLSFARGDWISTALPVGLSRANEPVWYQWSTGVPAAWQWCFSWLDDHDPAGLNTIFSLLVDRWLDPFWGPVLEHLVTYYVHGNRPRPTALAVVASQAGLELLTWLVLAADVARNKRGLTKSQFERLSAHERMTRTLHAAGIPTSVPPSLTELVNLVTNNRLHGGPNALTAMRNTVAHPTGRRRSYSDDAWLEAWFLAQWYQELLILRLLGYHGVYSNRLPDGSQAVGDTAPVPWPAGAAALG